MGTQVNGRRRIPNREKLTAEDDALNEIAREAEARLAAKRAARAEAREIRMKELERQQKEMYNSQKEESERYSHPSRRHTSISDDEERMSVGSRGSFRGAPSSELHCSSSSLPSLRHQSSAHNGRPSDYSGFLGSSSRASSRASSARASPVVEERPERDFLDKGSRTASTLSAATLASLGGPSSRRGSCDTSFSVETEASIRDMKDSLAESEDKYRRAMVSNAQLHNEKSYLMYQTDTLKEELADMEERLWEAKREHGDKAKELDRERHAHSILQFKFKNVEQTLAQSEELLNEVAQLRLVRDSSVREINDLQETLEWKEKKIAALERHVEFSDFVRGERDRLRGEVVRLRDVLKKHGIELAPEITTNGDAGQPETDDTDSKERLPCGGESMLGNVREQQMYFTLGRAHEGSSKHLTENVTMNMSAKVHKVSQSCPCSLVSEYTGIDARQETEIENHLSRRGEEDQCPVEHERQVGCPIRSNETAKQQNKNEPAYDTPTEGLINYTIQTDRAKGLMTPKRTKPNVQHHKEKYTKVTCSHLVKRPNKEAHRPEGQPKHKAIEFCFGGTNLHVSPNSSKMDQCPVKVHTSELVTPLITEAVFLQNKAVALNRSSGKQPSLSGDNQNNQPAVTTLHLTCQKELVLCSTAVLYQHQEVSRMIKTQSEENGICKDDQELRNSVQKNAGNILYDKWSDVDTLHSDGGERLVLDEKINHNATFQQNTSDERGTSHPTAVSEKRNQHLENAVHCISIPVENQIQNNRSMAQDYNSPISLLSDCCSSEQNVKLDQKTAGEQTTQTEWERAAPPTGLEPIAESDERIGRHRNCGSLLNITLEKESPLLKNETLQDIGGIWSGLGTKAPITSTVTDNGMLLETPGKTNVDIMPPRDLLYHGDNTTPTFKDVQKFERVTTQHIEHDPEEGKVEFCTRGSGSQDGVLCGTGDLESGSSRVALTADLLCQGTSADAESQSPRISKVEVGSSKPIVSSSSDTEVCFDNALEETVQGMMNGFMENSHMAAKISKILPQMPFLFHQWLSNLEDMQGNHADNGENTQGNHVENVEDTEQKHMENVEDIQQNNMDNLENIQKPSMENLQKATVNLGPLCYMKEPFGDCTPDVFQMTDNELAVKGYPDTGGIGSSQSQQGSPITNTMQQSTSWHRINSTKSKDHSVNVLQNSELLFHVPAVENRSTAKYSQKLFGGISGVWPNCNQELARTNMNGRPRVELELLGAEDPGNPKHQKGLKATTNCDEVVSIDSSKPIVLSEGQETKLKCNKLQLIRSKHTNQQRAKSGIEMLVYEIQEMVIPELAMIKDPLCEKHLKECQRSDGITTNRSKHYDWHREEVPIGLLDSCEEANPLSGIEATVKHQPTAQLELTILQPIAEDLVEERQTSLMPGCVKPTKKGLSNKRRNHNMCSIS